MKSIKFTFSFCIYDFHIHENEIQLDHIKIYAQEWNPQIKSTMEVIEGDYEL